MILEKWNIRIVGESRPFFYSGFKTKREALAFIDDWYGSGHTMKIELIKFDSKKGIYITC